MSVVAAAASAMSRGRLFVLEGGEGVGKTTQWQALRDALTAAGHEIVALREPGGTPAGDRIRSVLLDPASELSPESEALLFAASRAELVRAVIRPALARGAIVLLDRYLLSTYAYQGAGRGLPLPALQAINAFATDGVVPDATLLLVLPLDVAQARMQARGSADRMERETMAFHDRVHAAFTAATHTAWHVAHPDIGPVHAIDASGTATEVTARCLAQLAPLLPGPATLLTARDASSTRPVP